MTALPLRPALADVLAVLTGTQPAQWSPESYRVTVVNPAWVGRRHPPQGMGVDGGVPLTVTDPAEAFETLIARGVLPDAFAGDERRAFACEVCGGSGYTSRSGYASKRVRTCHVCGVQCATCGGAGDVLVAYTEGDTVPCEDCEEGVRRDSATGHVAHPPTIPALVAWASLGPAAIQRAEELARETVARLRPWGAPQPERVVWWVRDRGRGAEIVYPPSGTGGERFLCADGNADSTRWRYPPVPPAVDLWSVGLALDAITADAVTIVVPPIGGAL